jgi:hypothetical protein
MLLNSKFDILRGYPNQGAIDETFPIHSSGGVFDSIVLGMVVKVGTDGAVVAASTPDRSTVEAVATWVVVDGNDDFSGLFLEKAVCLRSNVVLRLDPSNFNAGTYTPGVKLTFVAGKWQPAVTNNQIIGEVIEDSTATDGTIVVMYIGGDTAAK